MKKIIFSTFCIIVANSVAIAQNPSELKKANGFYGQVKNFKEIKVNAKSQFGQVVTYDTTQITEQSYDFNGNDIGSRVRYPKYEMITTYELDERGYKIHGQELRDSKLYGELWYNEEGLKIKYKRGSLTYKYVYNEYGKCIIDSILSDDNMLSALNTYQYNRDSLLEVFTSYKADGSISSLVKHKYDEYKREILYSVTDPNKNSVTYVETKYDEKGRIKKETTTAPQYTNEVLYDYLDFGHDECTSEFKNYKSVYSTDIRQKDYEYEYDSHGNWIKKIIYDVDIQTQIKNATKVEYREIEYY